MLGEPEGQSDQGESDSDLEELCEELGRLYNSVSGRLQLSARCRTPSSRVHSQSTLDFNLNSEEERYNSPRQAEDAISNPLHDS